MTTSASDDKACVSKFNQVENDIQNYINAQLIILQDSAYDSGYEAAQSATRSAAGPAVQGVTAEARAWLDPNTGMVSGYPGGPYTVALVPAAPAVGDVVAVRALISAWNQRHVVFTEEGLFTSAEILRVMIDELEKALQVADVAQAGKVE